MDHSEYYNHTAIPNSIASKKFEITNLKYEDPDSLMNYQIGVLNDYSSEKPIFECDMPKKRFENDIGAQKIKFMSASGRYSTRPNHPDVFLGFTGRDPRGTREGHDWKKQYEYANSRKDMYLPNLAKDTDQTIAEGVKTDAQVIRNKVKIFDMFKKRLNWWQESYESNLPVSNAELLRKGKSRNLLSTIDENRLFNEFEQVNYTAPNRDIVNLFSNTKRVGWLNVPDNRLPIVNIAQLYKSKIPNGDFAKNSAQVKADSEFVNSSETKIPKSVVLLIDNIKRDKINKNSDTRDTRNKIHSEMLYNNQQQRTPDNTTGINQNILLSQKQAKLIEKSTSNKTEKFLSDVLKNSYQRVRSNKNKFDEKKTSNLKSKKNEDISKIVSNVIRQVKHSKLNDTTIKPTRQNLKLLMSNDVKEKNIVNFDKLHSKAMEQQLNNLKSINKVDLVKHNSNLTKEQMKAKLLEKNGILFKNSMPTEFIALPDNIDNIDRLTYDKELFFGNTRAQSQQAGMSKHIYNEHEQDDVVGELTSMFRK